MSTIFQDYKDYKQTKKDTKLIKEQLDYKFKTIVKPISLEELNSYKYKVEMLTVCGKGVYDGKNAKELREYLDKKGPLVHLPSCFCNVFASSLLEPKDILQHMIFTDFAKKEYKALDENNVIRCIHNQPDGVIYENRCANCSTEIFKNLIEYNSLKGDFQEAQDKQNQARQKLLSHFQFVKQN